MGSDVANRWAGEHAYPLEDSENLARVAQYVGVHQDDAMYPKELISAPNSGRCSRLQRRGRAACRACAPALPIYMTTNYDDFMFGALRRAGKDPRARDLPLERSLRA